MFSIKKEPSFDEVKERIRVSARFAELNIKSVSDLVPADLSLADLTREELLYLEDRTSWASSHMRALLERTGTVRNMSGR